MIKIKITETHISLVLIGITGIICFMLLKDSNKTADNSQPVISDTKIVKRHVETKYEFPSISENKSQDLNITNRSESHKIAKESNYKLPATGNNDIRLNNGDQTLVEPLAISIEPEAGPTYTPESYDKSAGIGNSKPEMVLVSDLPSEVSSLEKKNQVPLDIEFGFSTEGLNQIAQIDNEPDHVLRVKSQKIIENHSDRISTLEENYDEETVQVDDDTSNDFNESNDEPDVNILISQLEIENDTDIRLQALYALSEYAPELVENYLDDPEDLIRYEAEWLSGPFE